MSKGKAPTSFQYYLIQLNERHQTKYRLKDGKLVPIKKSK